MASRMQNEKLESWEQKLEQVHAIVSTFNDAAMIFVMKMDIFSSFHTIFAEFVRKFNICS